MPSPTTNLSGYVNGSDLLMKVANGAIGHCTQHSASYSTETKEVAIKPPASQAVSANALFKQKRVTGLAVQIKASGLKFYAETESGFKVLLGKWALGQSVACSLFEREYDTTPYLSGNFIISSLEETNPASEDGTFDVTLDNDGAVTIDDSKLDLLASSGVQL